MDLETIRQELDKRFSMPLQEFYRRRIIVWHDEEKEFENKIGELELQNAKVLVVTGNNYFEIKKTIGIDETAQNFLVYDPFYYDNLESNWLLDVELYSEEFRADLIAIWMDEMGLPSSISLRNQVKKYRKFLEEAAHRESLVKLSDSIDSPMKLQLAVMASIGEAQKTDPVAIIKSVLKAGLNRDDNYLYQGFVEYEASDLFWSMVSQVTGYDDENHDLGQLAAHIILSAASRTLPVEVFDGLSDFMSENSQLQAYCNDIVSDWIHGTDSASYLNIAESVEDEMHLEERLSSLEAETLADTEILPCVHKIILGKIMTDISNEIIEPDKISIISEKRRPLAWYDQYKYYYDGILSLAKMETFYKNNAAGFHTIGAKEIWKAYTSDYYQMDTYYRQFHLCYENSKKSYGGDLQDLFTKVCDKVERLYTNWFLDGLGQNWSQEAASELAEKGYIDGIERQEEFYERRVSNADNKVYVIISDALRYEVATSLKDELSREMQGKVSLSSMQAVFPTETKYGMAALLPHKELTAVLKEDGNGKKELRILVDGQSSDSVNREKVLKTANPNSVTIKAKTMMGMNRAERSEIVKGKDVVYIYHDTIDHTSHTSETKTFNACEESIQEIITLVRTIVNDFGGINILITADHGFLYTYSPLTEETKTEKSEFVNRIVEYTRRFAILTKGADPEYLLPVKFMDGKTDYLGYAPRGDIRIKTSAGSGMNFVHGGVSLQEMCVPLIEYKHLRNSSKEYQKNKEKYDTKPVEVSLLSATHKLSNMIFSLNFYQKDAVSGNREKAVYNTYFVDSAGKKISDIQKIYADKAEPDTPSRTFRCNFSLKSQAYDSTATYYLLIEREGGTEPPQRIEFQIDIAFGGEDFGFFS